MIATGAAAAAAAAAAGKAERNVTAAAAAGKAERNVTVRCARKFLVGRRVWVEVVVAHRVRALDARARVAGTCARDGGKRALITRLPAGLEVACAREGRGRGCMCARGAGARLPMRAKDGIEGPCPRPCPHLRIDWSLTCSCCCTASRT